MEVFGFKELNRQKSLEKIKNGSKISVFKLKITFFFLNLGFLVFFDELEGLFQD